MITLAPPSSSCTAKNCEMMPVDGAAAGAGGALMGHAVISLHQSNSQGGMSFEEFSIPFPF